MRLLAWLKRKLTLSRSKRVANGTVRYMFPALLGSVAILSASVIGGSAQSYVYLNSDSRTVAVGDIFSVEVGVSAHTPINAIDLTLEFPSDKVEVFSVDRGQSVLTIWTEDPIVKNNSVRLTGGTFRRGFVGEHEVATIKLRALGTGQYDLVTNNIKFVAGDGEGSVVPVSESAVGSVSVFNFDENTSQEEIAVAIASGITTDINQDGRVTLQDISAFMAVWNDQSRVLDFNNDGRMSFKDFSIILADFFLR